MKKERIKIVEEHADLHLLYKHCQDKEEKKNIKNKHYSLVNEMEKANMRHRLIDDLDSEPLGDVIKLEEVLKYLRNFYIEKHIIFLTGSLVENGFGNDIDIVSRRPLSDAEIFNIRRLFPEHLQPKLNIIYDPRACFTSYIPLWNVCWEMHPAEIVSMSKISQEKKEEAEKSIREGKIEVLRFFYPVRLRGRDMQKYLNDRELLSFGYPVVVQQKFDGDRLTIHKKDKEIRAFSSSGLDYSVRFPFLDELRQIEEDIIIDAIITRKQSGSCISKKGFVGYINTIPSADDFCLWVFDCIYFNKDYHCETLVERLEILHYLENKYNFTNIYFAESVFCRTYIEMRNTVQRFFNRNFYPDSVGAIIKNAFSIYELNGGTKEWIKINFDFDIYAEIVYVDDYIYYCIIRTPEGEKIPIGKILNIQLVDHIGRPLAILAGNIIKVTFANLSKYFDMDTYRVHYCWQNPKAIECCEDIKFPDTTDYADIVVIKSLGEIKEKDYPAEFSNFVSAFENRYDNQNKNNEKILPLDCRTFLPFTGIDIARSVEYFPLPNEYKIYIEAFAGFATLFFQLPKAPDKTVLIEKDPHKHFLLSFLQTVTDEEIRHLMSVKWRISRLERKKLIKQIKNNEFSDNKLERFIQLFQIITNSAFFASIVHPGMCTNITTSSVLKLIAQFANWREKLKNAEIILDEWIRFLEWDSLDTFIFFDPPYQKRLYIEYVPLEEILEHLKKIKKAKYIFLWCAQNRKELFHFKKQILNALPNLNYKTKINHRHSAKSQPILNYLMIFRNYEI